MGASTNFSYPGQIFVRILRANRCQQTSGYAFESWMIIINSLRNLALGTAASI
jgi:hypothetical protein